MAEANDAPTSANATPYDGNNDAESMGSELETPGPVRVLFGDNNGEEGKEPDNDVSIHTPTSPSTPQYLRDPRLL